MIPHPARNPQAGFLHAPLYTAQSLFPNCISPASLLYCQRNQPRHQRRATPMKLTDINIRDPFVLLHEGKY